MFWPPAKTFYLFCLPEHSVDRDSTPARSIRETQTENLKQHLHTVQAKTDSSGGQRLCPHWELVSFQQFKQWKSKEDDALLVLTALGSNL